jgi:hypothetical protein
MRVGCRLVFTSVSRLVFFKPSTGVGFLSLMQGGYNVVQNLGTLACCVCQHRLPACKPSVLPTHQYKELISTLLPALSKVGMPQTGSRGGALGCVFCDLLQRGVSYNSLLQCHKQGSGVQSCCCLWPVAAGVQAGRQADGGAECSWRQTAGCATLDEYVCMHTCMPREVTVRII